MVKNLRRKGDSVRTSGGTVGKVTKLVDDEQIEIEIAQGVRVRQLRSMVSEVRAKGQPVATTTGTPPSWRRRNPKVFRNPRADATRAHFARWKAVAIVLMRR